MANDLCSVLITEWISWNSGAGLLSQSFQKKWPSFMRRGRLYLHVLIPYRKIWIEVSVMEVSSEDVTIHGIVWQIFGIKKKN
jgi:hypothetical protein